MSKSFTSAVVLCGAMVCCGTAFGQNATPPEDRADRKVTGAANESPPNANGVREGVQTRQDARQGDQNRAVRQAGYTQHDLASILTIANEGEVAISKIGVEKAQHADVKKFAEEMVKVHGDMIAKIQQADAAGIAAADAGAGAAAQPQQNAGRRSASVEPTGDSPMVSLKRELAAQCLQSKQDELGKKQGAEFDKCFMGAQLGMHMEAIDTMKVFQRHTSGELKNTIDEGIKTAESHLEHAKSIMKTLETAAK